MGKGNLFAKDAVSFPGEERSLGGRWPRATVPGTTGRSLRPSSKNVVGSYGRYFGCSCMSMRQPANSRASALRQIIRAVRAFVALAIPDWKLDFNLKYSVWIQAFQKLFGLR